MNVKVTGPPRSVGNRLDRHTVDPTEGPREARRRGETASGGGNLPRLPAPGEKDCPFKPAPFGKAAQAFAGERAEHAVEVERRKARDRSDPFERQRFVGVRFDVGDGTRDPRFVSLAVVARFGHICPISLPQYASQPTARQSNAATTHFLRKCSAQDPPQEREGSVRKVLQNPLRI